MLVLGPGDQAAQWRARMPAASDGTRGSELLRALMVAPSIDLGNECGRTAFQRPDPRTQDALSQRTRLVPRKKRGEVEPDRLIVS